MIKLSIGQDFVFQPWWDNLFEAATQDELFPWEEVDSFLLKNYNGRVLYGEPDPNYDEPPIEFVEFDTEEEVCTFLLRWS